MTGARSGRCAAPVLAGLLLALLTAGCTSTTVKTVTFEGAERARDIREEELLDVGIAEFDPSIPEDWTEQEAANVIPDVREAEARYLPQVLKATLQESGNWGAVRVLPRASAAVDLAVEGRILVSDGELLEIGIRAEDATGRLWLDEVYSYRTSKYAYEFDAADQVDPFQPLYNRVANDLLEVFRDLDAREHRRIRQIAEMRFAREFAPEAFADYVTEDRGGRWRLQRLPAEDDPRLDRIRRVREREYLFIDTLDEYYTAFRRDMSAAYQDYRRYTYDEAMQKRALERDGRQAWRTAAVSVAAATALVLASENSAVDYSAAVAGVAGAAMSARRALATRREAALYRDAIRELGMQLEGEVTPLVIELDDRTYTLTGSVDEQYERWRGILRDLYAEEYGLPQETAAADAPADAGS